jgi:hypothetical protein
VAHKKQLEDGVPETLTPPAPHPKLADVGPAAEGPEPPAEQVEATVVGGDLSEDEIEDRALDSLDVTGGSVLVDAVPEPVAETAPAVADEPEDAATEAAKADEPEAPTESPAAVDDETPAREPAVPAAELPSAPDALAATNGRRPLENALSLALPGQDLARTRNVSLDLQLRDERDRVIHQVRDIQWSLQDVDDLQTVYLQLKIGLEREDT